MLCNLIARFQYLTNAGMRKMDYKMFLMNMNAPISYSKQLGYGRILPMFTKIHGGGRCLVLLRKTVSKATLCQQQARQVQT